MLTSSSVDVDAVILVCVQKGLDHFGSTFKFVIYHELKKADNLEGKRIVQKPLTFSNTLDKLFGDGSVAIKKAIMAELSKEFSVSTRQEDLVSMINRVRSNVEV